MNIQQFRNTLPELTPLTFDEQALQLFRYQAENNPTYKEFISYLKITPNTIKSVNDIPFMPIEFFKSHPIKCGHWEADTIFTSSGTTGNETSKHEISSLPFYLSNTKVIFEEKYAPIKEFVVLALLPAYLERKGSGLISMTNHFIELNTSPHSGFYLYNHKELFEQLVQLKEKGQKTLLIGVTFGLLDFTENYSIHFPELIVMETGGMKGRKEEITRPEVHQLLKKAFKTEHIHSEYGMTELQSQAYSKGNGLFDCPNWMKVLIRETDDPLTLAKTGKSGGINIIDLANTDTCAFIATQDVGKLHSNNQFEVLGRFDHSDTRGCNLMIV